MRLRSVTIVATFTIVFGSVATAPSSAAPTPGTAYLALGDSVAASYQPNGDTHSGFAEQVLQLEQAGLPDLRLVKLACPGERTSTFDRAKPAARTPSEPSSRRRWPCWGAGTSRSSRSRSAGTT